MLAIDDICRIVGKSRPTVAKHPHLEQYRVTAESNGGRPRVLYSDEVIGLFGLSPKMHRSATPAVRQSRSDRGKTRKYDEVAVSRWVDMTEALLLSLGEYNQYFAAESALKHLANEQPESAGMIYDNLWYCYKRFILPELKKRKTREFWQHRNQRHSTALQSVQLRYDVPSMLENAGLAGLGYGFGRMIMLDDRVSKIRVAQDGSFYQHNGIYAWCVLSGALLHVESIPIGTGVNTQSYARTILAMIFAHRIPRNPVVFLENASSAMATRLENLIRELWDEDELRRVRADKTLRAAFGGQTPPVIRNLPHMPTAFGKATGEAFMRTILRRHDAVFREQFSRVSLDVSNQPWLVKKTPNRMLEKISKNGLLTWDEYGDSVMEWFWNIRQYDRVKSLEKWANARNLESTRHQMIEYYSGSDYPLARDLAMERIGRIVFHASPTRLFHKCTTPGQFSGTIQKNKIHLVCGGITIHQVGERLGAVPNPLADSEWLIYQMEPDSEYPLIFLGIGLNANVSSFEVASVLRGTVSAERRRIEGEIMAEMRDKLAKLPSWGMPESEDIELPPSTKTPPLPPAEPDVVEVKNPEICHNKPIDTDEWDDDIFEDL